MVGRPVSREPSARYDPDQVPEGARRDLLDRVPATGTVVDVGCWSGFAGRYLLLTRPALRIDGVEPEASMAEVARSRGYRAVSVAPAEAALPDLAAAGAAYDVVLFMDVLEHLADPVSVLRAARRLVGADARLLVSIPNVAHWSVRKELLLGRFQYAEHGILDRTHLRFYTTNTAKHLLEEGGWRVSWRGWSLGQPPLVRVADRGMRVLVRWPALFAVQSLFEAVPDGD